MVGDVERGMVESYCVGMTLKETFIVFVLCIAALRFANYGSLISYRSDTTCSSVQITLTEKCHSFYLISRLR